MLKKFLRWLIIGGTLFFVLSNLKNNWDNVTSVRIENHGWLFLFLALVTTIIAQIWAGWVWTWILKSYQQPIKTSAGIGIYMITNLGKYLPGNIGHFYARIVAINKAGSDWGTASLSVLLELLLLVCAALAIAVIGSGLGWMKSSSSLGIQILVLGLILIGIHPKFLNYPLKIL
ncbi:MAG: lysylphosphatidylglycerol synthase domain-containing protein, partial [Microcystis sp. M49637_WE12]|nr:lysylphosphatidylglycerol synthase domain-containing protein [Microcystis sp. M49637_WE12]